MIWGISINFIIEAGLELKYTVIETGRSIRARSNSRIYDSMEKKKEKSTI